MPPHSVVLFRGRICHDSALAPGTVAVAVDTERQKAHATDRPDYVVTVLDEFSPLVLHFCRVFHWAHLFSSRFAARNAHGIARSTSFSTLLNEIISKCNCIFQENLQKLQNFSSVVILLVLLVNLMVYCHSISKIIINNKVRLTSNSKCWVISSIKRPVLILRTFLKCKYNFLL